MTICLISPLFDIPTSLSSIAVNNLAGFLKSRGIPYYLLAGLLPSRFFFETFLATHPDIDTLWYYGHGSESLLYGIEIFASMINLSNDGLLKDKIVYTMACLSGVELGPDTIKKGCRAYFGHLTLYNAAYPDEGHDWLKDWIDYVTHVPKLLAQGRTCGEAFEGYKVKLGQYVAQYKSFAENPAKYLNADWIVTTAESNLIHARLFGDTNAKLSLPPATP